MKNNYLLLAEEELNTTECISMRSQPNVEHIHKYKSYIDAELRLFENDNCNEHTFYHEVCDYIRMISNPNFIKFHKRKNNISINDKTYPEEQPDHNLDIPQFCLYAYIDRRTWGHIRTGQNISKETSLKLVIALQLTEKDANDLLSKISYVLNPIDFRDKLVIALLNVQCYNPDQANEVLEWYIANGKIKFTNIYNIN